MAISNMLQSGCCCGGSAPSHLCPGPCNVPVTLSCNWQYRSVSSALPANCSPNAGNAITSLTFPMVYDATASGWLSGFMVINDHQYGCNPYAANYVAHITPGYFVRIMMICFPTWSLYLQAVPTMATTPYPIGSSGTPAIGPGSYCQAGLGTPTCSPFLASVATYDGPGVVTPGDCFDSFVLTP